MIVARAFNPSTQEVQAGGPFQIHSQPGLHSEFQVRQGYIVRPCLFLIT